MYHNYSRLGDLKHKSTRSNKQEKKNPSQKYQETTNIHHKSVNKLCVIRGALVSRADG